MARSVRHSTTSPAQHLAVPPSDNRRLVLFILALVLSVGLGLATIYYNLRRPVKNGGVDLWQLMAQSFRAEPTLPR